METLIFCMNEGVNIHTYCRRYILDVLANQDYLITLGTSLTCLNTSELYHLNCSESHVRAIEDAALHALTEQNRQATENEGYSLIYLKHLTLNIIQ